MRRLLKNVGLYFVIVPTAYTVLIIANEGRLNEWYGWPLYYVFTAPAWPLCAILIPLVELAAKSVPRSSVLTGRGAAVATAAVAAGILPLAVAWHAVPVFLLAGALYGWTYRLPPVETPRSLPEATAL
jgi:hypothetical protein